MKNASKAIRDAYYSALSGISYGGNSVPVYKILPVATLGDHYIEIADIIEVGEQNDHKFIRECVVTVEIVSTQYNYRDYGAVDTITDSVLQALLATVGGSLTNTDFQIGHIQLESSRYLSEDEGSRYMTRKILQFSQLLIQK